MHVTQLLDLLLFGPHVEIVEAFLPYGSGSGVGEPTHRKRRDEWAPSAMSGAPLAMSGAPSVLSFLVNLSFMTFITTEGSPTSGSVISR